MHFMDISISIEELHFEIYSKKGRSVELIKKDKLIIPKALGLGDKLSFLRNTIAFIIKDYKVSKANIILIEDDTEDIINIIKFEAIIEELLSSSGVEICK